MVAVRVVMGWLMLTLGRVINREKERSDMMTVGNGKSVRNTQFKNVEVEGAIQLFTITLPLHIEQFELNQLTSLYRYP